jgi:hypothetical protein
MQLRDPRHIFAPFHPETCSKRHARVQPHGTDHNPPGIKIIWRISMIIEADSRSSSLGSTVGLPG